MKKVKNLQSSHILGFNESSLIIASYGVFLKKALPISPLPVTVIVFASKYGIEVYA